MDQLAWGQHTLWRMLGPYDALCQADHLDKEQVWIGRVSGSSVKTWMESGPTQLGPRKGWALPFSRAFPGSLALVICHLPSCCSRWCRCYRVEVWEYSRVWVMTLMVPDVMIGLSRMYLCVWKAKNAKKFMFLVLNHWDFTGNSMFYPVGPGVVSGAYCGLSPFLCMWFLVSGIFIDVDYAGVTTLSCWCSFFLPRTSSFPFSFSSSGSYGRGGVLVGGL